MTAVMKKMDPEELMKDSEIETGISTRYRLEYGKKEKERKRTRRN
jgi:hypothetical protein